MTKRQKTHVAIILDKSGSMASTKEAAISGFNEQVQQWKEDSKDQDILCSLVTFNGQVYEHLWNVPVDQLNEANPNDFQPTGSTAMLDAVGYTVQKLLNTTDHEDPNTAYLIVTISDGDTNADHHYGWAALKELTQSCEASKKWTFTYMGCSKQYMEQLANQVGTKIANMAAWSNTSNAGTATGFNNLKSRSAKYFAERGAGQLASECYTSDSGDVADFEKGPQGYQAAPVIQAAVSVDYSAILQKQPKYDCSPQLCNPYVAGTPIFSVSNRVEWIDEKKPESVSIGQPFGNTANIANFARVGKIKP